MGVMENPESSNASRISPTRPSIMSEGATMSAPARAWDTAHRANKVQGGVVVDEVLFDNAAMSGVRVLAQAHVGDDHAGPEACP